MGYKLDWGKLLSSERIRNSSASARHRNAFELDYDRIVGSSSVRRLQDKAQVFPLQENDFTRTRLTHSLEVSALAKSLGKAVGLKILDTKIDPTFDATKVEELISLLQTAGLIHDLGNPPFGHYGETVIRQWFADWFDGSHYKKIMSNLKKEDIMVDEQMKDFLFFDGNVQNLRIVTKLQMLNDQYGANLTYATLASLIKYPWSSNDADTKPNKKQAKNKYGYYQSEKGLVEAIWKATGLEEGIRHPATFLLEAADDITYICDDIEDGVKKEKIDWEKEFKNIQKEFTGEFYKPLFDRLDKINSTMRDSIPEKMSASVLNFRNAAQGFMLVHAENSFINHYNQIMNGEFGINELLDFDEIKPFIKYLKNIARNSCFNCKEVLTLELIGDKVIKGLLDIFIPAIVEATNIEDTRTYAGKLYSIISPNFKYIAKFDYNKNCEREFSELSLYEKMQLITDYISGMTDSYAVNLYKELTGYKLP